MPFSQVKNIVNARRRAYNEELRASARGADNRPPQMPRIDTTSKRGRREAFNLFVNILLTFSATLGFVTLRFHLLSSEELPPTSSPYITYPPSKIRRKGFQSNFVHKYRPICLNSNDVGNFTHRILWELEEVCEGGGEVESCEQSSSPNYVSTGEYALANLEKFKGVRLPDFADHLQNFTSTTTTQTTTWTSNLTRAIELGMVNGMYGRVQNLSSPIHGDTLPSGELLFPTFNLAELWVAAVSGAFKVTVKGGGEWYDGISTLSEGSMLYLPSPYKSVPDFKVFLEGLVDGSVLIGVSRGKDQPMGNVQYPEKPKS